MENLVELRPIKHGFLVFPFFGKHPVNPHNVNDARMFGFTHFRHYNIFTYRGYYSFYFVLYSNRNVYRLMRYYASMEKEICEPFTVVYMTHGDLRFRCMPNPAQEWVVKSFAKRVAREISES